MHTYLVTVGGALTVQITASSQPEACFAAQELYGHCKTRATRLPCINH